MVQRRIMDVLCHDSLLKIASFLDTTSIMNFGLSCKNTKELMLFARSVVDANACQQVERMVQHSVSTLEVITDEDKRLAIACEMLRKSDKRIIVEGFHQYMTQFGDDSIDTNVIQQTLDIMRASTDATYVLSKLTPMQKNIWKLFEDFMIGRKHYINLSWTLEYDGEEVEVSINIRKNDIMTVTIYNNVDIIPSMESFHMNDISGIVSFVQNNMYTQYFEDAKCHLLLLRNDDWNNPLTNMSIYNHIRQSINATKHQ